MNQSCVFVQCVTDLLFSHTSRTNISGTLFFKKIVGCSVLSFIQTLNFETLGPVSFLKWRKPMKKHDHCCDVHFSLGKDQLCEEQCVKHAHFCVDSLSVSSDFPYLFLMFPVFGVGLAKQPDIPLQ